MYTVTITEKNILIQEEKMVLTVQLKSEEPIEENVDLVKRDEEGNPKLGKDGKPKMKRPVVKFATKIFYAKFDLDVSLADVKKEIKRKLIAIIKAESNEIPIGVPIEFTI